MLDDAQQTRWPVLIQDLVQHYTVLWHESDTGLPWLGPSFTSGAQRSNERHLDRFLAAVSAELKSAPQTGSQQAMWTRIGLAFRNVARTALDADERALETLLGCGFLEATTEFVQMARRFDPAITSKDIYQAGRNVWTANLLQLLLGIPVRVTPAIFAYSMLYPYSDNYLDDPAIPNRDQAGLQRALPHPPGGRAAGAARPARADYLRPGRADRGPVRPRAVPRRSSRVSWRSIGHKAKASSKCAAAQRHSRSTCWGSSFEKGGTSVLADGYLVAGSLTAEQRECIFGFGVLTQLMDDLEDLPHNLADQFLTIFSRPLNKGRWTRSLTAPCSCAVESCGNWMASAQPIWGLSRI